jgi:hypothetical protein
MSLLTMLLAVLGFPWLCLGFVLWMGRFEDGLPAAVRRAQHVPDPPPIVAVAVRAPRRADPAGGAGVEPVPLSVAPPAAPLAVPGQRLPEPAVPQVVPPVQPVPTSSTGTG